MLPIRLALFLAVSATLRSASALYSTLKSSRRVGRLCGNRKQVFISSATVNNQVYTPDAITTDDAKIDWSFVDAVYLITTTKSDPLRLERSKCELEAVNLWDSVRIRTFKPDDEDRIRGCYTSHINVLAEAEKELGKKNKDYKILVLEDNISKTFRYDPAVIRTAVEFVNEEKELWDVFFLAYMMYVPSLSVKLLSKVDDEVKDKPYSNNVVRLVGDSESPVGTTAYIMSSRGVRSVLSAHKADGYKNAIPNIMAQLFQSSRYGVYPMQFHRAAKVPSLVNPQLDDFRKIMFFPVTYTAWEGLMVSTGLKNSMLFPSLVASVTTSLLTSAFYHIVYHTN